MSSSVSHWNEFYNKKFASLAGVFNFSVKTVQREFLFRLQTLQDFVFSSYLSLPYNPFGPLKPQAVNLRLNFSIQILFAECTCIEQMSAAYLDRSWSWLESNPGRDSFEAT